MGSLPSRVIFALGLSLTWVLVFFIGFAWNSHLGSSLAFWMFFGFARLGYFVFHGLRVVTTFCILDSSGDNVTVAGVPWVSP